MRRHTNPLVLALFCVALAVVAVAGLVAFFVVAPFVLVIAALIHIISTLD